MMARQLIVGTAGHIDHGKTALVRALTGIDTDRLPQEKQRGITIDIGFAHLHVPGFHLGVIDVPGHERFIKNMLAGAAGIDVALLVVAADDSVMPQTREHLAILQLFRVKSGLVALTKSDLAETSWIDLVEEEVRELVVGSFLEGAPIVRTSATQGTGLDELKRCLADICTTVPDADSDDGPFRMAVDRSFVKPGLGTLVTGTVWSGAAAVGDELDWLPSGKRLRIRGLQSHGTATECIGKGQRAAVNLTGVHHTEIRRGHEIATPGYIEPTRRLTVELHALENSPWPIRHRSRLRLYLGTQEIIAGVRLLDRPAIDPGDSAPAQLICANPVVAVGQQPFVVRAESPLVTVGGGHVLLPNYGLISRRSKVVIEQFQPLREDDELRRAAAAILLRDAATWSDLDLARDLGVTPDRAQALVDALLTDGRIVRIPIGPKQTLRIHRECLRRLHTRIMETVGQLHVASPLEVRIPRQRVLARLNYLPDDVLAAVIDQLIGLSLLTGDDTAIAAPDFEPALTAAQEQLRQHVIKAFELAEFSPPDAATLARQWAATTDEIQPIITLCVAQGHLIHLGGSTYLHKRCHAELHRRIIEKIGAAGDEGMTVSRIRELLGTSRKYALPICEYLDRVGITRRVGDVRILGPNAFMQEAGAERRAEPSE